MQESIRIKNNIIIAYCIL